jgi:hypothetical protein
VLCFATKTRMHYLKYTAKSLALFSEEMPQPSLTSAFSISPDRLRLTESIERCVEDQAFSPSYDFTLPPPPPPSQQVDALYLSSICHRSSILTGEGVRKGAVEEPNHTTARKPGPLLDHSILSDVSISGEVSRRAYLLTASLV